MTKISMSASDVLKHMENGAQFHRAFGDKIELRIPGKGIVIIPLEIFDALLDENKIVSQSGQLNGFYRVVRP
jgi:hypothetical protein